MILVFGSLNADLVIRVPALPRPGETVLSDDYAIKPGGKGNNQAVAAARAGAEVMMVGSVGNDAFGDGLVANLQANRVNIAGVHRSAKPTGIAYICVDPAGENFITVAAGANRDTRADFVPEAALGLGAATVLMQLEVPHAETWALVRHAHECGARTVLSVAPAAPVPRTVLETLDVVVANEGEARVLAEAEGLTRREGPELAAAISAAARVCCVLTLGPDGALAADRGRVWIVDRMAIEPVDTTGAGDAFTGILAAALDNGDVLPAAMHRAAVGAGLACLALGAQESLPSAADIEANLHRVPPPRRIEVTGS
jgi:ribokinase